VATLPSTYQFVPADNGSHAFPNGMTLRTAGNMVVNVQDVNTLTLKGTIQVTVNPGAPAQIKVVGSPTTVTAGNQFTLTVTVQDQFANIVTGYRGTVFFKTTDQNGTVPGAYAYLPTDNGVHVFRPGRKRFRQPIPPTLPSRAARRSASGPHRSVN
jgi:hypothetical protein